MLRQTPVPSFTPAQIEEITILVDAYKDFRWAHIDEQPPWIGLIAEQGRRALLKIDAAVLEAYALPPDLEADLLHLFDGVERRHLPFAFTGYDPQEWANAKPNSPTTAKRGALRMPSPPCCKSGTFPA